MKKIFSTTLSLTLGILTLGMILTSCNEKSGDEPSPEETFLAMATFVSSNESGTTVTVQPEGDISPLYTLVFPGSRVTGIKEGTRLMIAYTTEAGTPFANGPGRLYATGYVYNSAITEGTKESTNSWRSMQQELLSIWQTGTWINLQTYCTYYKEKPLKYDIVVDKTTLEDDYPMAYMIYEADNSVNADTKVFYSTFDISSVWNRENVKGLKIKILTGVGTQTYTFDKSGSGAVSPM